PHWRRYCPGRWYFDGEGQVSDVQHELPDIPVGQIPGGHPSVPDAVADMVEYLAVSQQAGDGDPAQRGWTRILASADLRVTAAVVGVTHLAFLPEQRGACRNVGLTGGQGVGAGSKVRRNAVAQQP